MTLSQSLIILKNWPLSLATLSVPFAGILNSTTGWLSSRSHSLRRWFPKAPATAYFVLALFSVQGSGVALAQSSPQQPSSTKPQLTDPAQPTRRAQGDGESCPTSSAEVLTHARQRAALKDYPAAIACLKRYLMTAPDDNDARAQLVRSYAWQKNYQAAWRELKGSSLAGTAQGHELAGDLAWYQGQPKSSARHYRNAARAWLSDTHGKGTSPQSRIKGRGEAARLWGKVIRGYRAAKDRSRESKAVKQAQSMVASWRPAEQDSKTADADSRALLAALNALDASVAVPTATAPLATTDTSVQAQAPKLAAVRATPRSGESPAAFTAKKGFAAGLGYQVASATEFIFIDRYSAKGYSRSIAGQGGMRGRHVTITGIVRHESTANRLVQLGLIGERRERFFGVGAEPVDTIGGLSLGLGIGQPRHSFGLQLLWTQQPKFTYHNQFTASYSLPIAVGSVDFSLRHSAYPFSTTDRLTIGLSYYRDQWLWLPKLMTTYAKAEGVEPSWYSAAELKGVHYRGPYTFQAWLGSGQGQANQPLPGKSADRITYVAFGGSVARRFRLGSSAQSGMAQSLHAGLSAARHNEPRYHENTIGLNLSWRRF